MITLHSRHKPKPIISGVYPEKGMGPTAGSSLGVVKNKKGMDTGKIEESGTRGEGEVSRSRHSEDKRIEDSEGMGEGWG